MKTVRKANKVLTIADELLSGYIKEGFDEIDEKGKVKTVSPTKTYTAAEVEKLMAEYEAKLAAKDKEIAALKGKSKTAKNEDIPDGTVVIGRDGVQGVPGNVK